MPGGTSRFLAGVQTREMTWEVVEESWYGLTVVVNHRLSYRFDIQETEPLIVRSTFLDPAREDAYPWGPNCSWMPARP